MKTLCAIMPLAVLTLTVAIQTNGMEIEERGSLRGHKFVGISSVFFSPDGKSLLSTGVDGSISFWDVTTMKEKTNLKGPTGMFCAAWCD